METALQISEQEIQESTDFAQKIQVTNNEQYQAAMTARKGLSELRKQIVEHHRPIKQKLDEAKRTVLDQEKKLLGPVDDALILIDSKLSLWFEAERLRLQEVNRKAQEAARIAQEAQKKAEVKELTRQGFKDEARALSSAPVVPVNVPQREIPKVAGVTMATYYRAEVLDLSVLVKAVAAGGAPLEALEANQVALNKLASALKEGFKLPGVKLVIEQKPRGTR